MVDGYKKFVIEGFEEFFEYQSLEEQEKQIDSANVTDIVYYSLYLTLVYRDYQNVLAKQKSYFSLAKTSLTTHWFLAIIKL